MTGPDYTEIQDSDMRSAICKLMSEMLDNPNEHGIYQTSRFMWKMEQYWIKRFGDTTAQLDTLESEAVTLHEEAATGRKAFSDLMNNTDITATALRENLADAEETIQRTLEIGAGRVTEVDALRAEAAEKEKSTRNTAQQALIVMQLDLGYHQGYVPKYNRDPIRHQLAWAYAEQVLGGEAKIDWIDAEDRAQAKGVDCRTDSPTPPAPEPRMKACPDWRCAQQLDESTARVRWDENCPRCGKRKIHEFIFMGPSPVADEVMTRPRPSLADEHEWAAGTKVLIEDGPLDTLTTDEE